MKAPAVLLLLFLKRSKFAGVLFFLLRRRIVLAVLLPLLIYIAAG